MDIISSKYMKYQVPFPFKLGKHKERLLLLAKDLLKLMDNNLRLKKKLMINIKSYLITEN